MPYSNISELPASVKNSLPERAQSIWLKIVNNAIKTYGDESTAFATAWAGLKNAGWSKSTDGKWVEKISKYFQDFISSGELDKTFSFEIKKSIEDKRLVFGWSMMSRDHLGNEVWDKQDDSIDPDDLEDLSYRYARFYRNLGELHINSGLGLMIESVVTTLEKQRIWGVPANCMPIGWWMGFYVEDLSAWEKIKNGTYKAFSVQGTAQRILI